KARRPASHATGHEIRAGHQSQGRQGARPANPRQAARARRRGDRVRRRQFITLLGGAAAAWPLAARAQQPAKGPRVGILSPAASETAATLTAFREGIRDLGYIEGQTIALDFRLSKGVMDALPALAAELVRIPVNVIVTDSTGGTLAAFTATRTIPIVM